MVSGAGGINLTGSVITSVKLSDTISQIISLILKWSLRSLSKLHQIHHSGAGSDHNWSTLVIIKPDSAQILYAGLTLGSINTTTQTSLFVFFKSYSLIMQRSPHPEETVIDYFKILLTV